MVKAWVTGLEPVVNPVMVFTEFICTVGENESTCLVKGIPDIFPVSLRLDLVGRFRVLDNEVKSLRNVSSRLVRGCKGEMVAVNLVEIGGLSLDEGKPFRFWERNVVHGVEN